MSEYKAKLYGKQVVMLSKTFASNQLCTNYEYKNKDFKNLAIRERCITLLVAYITIT